jgi:hypothetical protein
MVWKLGGAVYLCAKLNMFCKHILVKVEICLIGVNTVYCVKFNSAVFGPLLFHRPLFDEMLLRIMTKFRCKCLNMREE